MQFQMMECGHKLWDKPKHVRKSMQRYECSVWMYTRAATVCGKAPTIHLLASTWRCSWGCKLYISVTIVIGGHIGTCQGYYSFTNPTAPPSSEGSTTSRFFFVKRICAFLGWSIYVTVVFHHPRVGMYPRSQGHHLKLGDGDCPLVICETLCELEHDQL